MPEFDPSGVTEGLGAVQSVISLINAAKTKKRIVGLLGQRTAYTTPDEIFQILNATESNAQGDTATRDFQSNQIDRTFSNSLGTAQLLGADPNDLSSLFEQKISGIIKVGQDFHTSNMEAFGKYLGALDMVAENRAAEWQSQQDIIKDKLQAEGANLANNYANLNSGVNAVLSGLSTDAMAKLYKENSKKKDTVNFPNILTANTLLH